jgi:hypothetical protein
MSCCSAGIDAHVWEHVDATPLAVTCCTRKLQMQTAAPVPSHREMLPVVPGNVICDTSGTQAYTMLSPQP